MLITVVEQGFFFRKQNKPASIYCFASTFILAESGSELNMFHFVSLPEQLFLLLRNMNSFFSLEYCRGTEVDGMDEDAKILARITDE